MHGKTAAAAGERVNALLPEVVALIAPLPNQIDRNVLFHYSNFIILSKGNLNLLKHHLIPTFTS